MAKRGKKSTAKKPSADGKPSAEGVFLREVSVVRYRSKKTGRFTTRRKGARRWVTRRIEEVAGDVVRTVGVLNDGGKERILRTEAVQKNLFVRDEIAGAAKIARKGFKGLEVSVRGRGRNGRAVSIKTRIFLSKRERKDAKRLTALVTGRVLDSIRAKNYRLSTLKIGGRSKKNRTRAFLKNATMTISGFY